MNALNVEAIIDIYMKLMVNIAYIDSDMGLVIIIPQ